MNFLTGLIISTGLVILRLNVLSASYQCGTRKHGFLPLLYRGWKVEEGQWPWHVAIFFKQPLETLKYQCGGSLLSEKHILTAGHCVVNRKTSAPRPKEIFELHLGQHNLSEVTDLVQIRDVSKVHVHPEYSTLRNDIAMLVMRLAVAYTDYVIPICIDQKVDRDLRNLEGDRGWITGWGVTESGNVSDVLWTASLSVVSYLSCTKNDPVLFGNLLNETVFCAGDLNGTSPGPGDSGGGMYFYDGDRWVLRGVVSFAKVDPVTKQVDTSKYAVFANVQRFLTWIQWVLTEDEPQTVRRPKRISETECEKFRQFVSKRKSGDCTNSRHPHSILISYSNADPHLSKCNGALVSEHFAITTCLCTSTPAQVLINGYGSVDIAEVTCYPEYSDSPKIHDLALVKMVKPVQLASNVIPACLASNWTENLYDTLVQTGVGFNRTTGARQIFETDENEVITEKRCFKIFDLEHVNVTRPGELCVINIDPLRIGLGGILGSPLQSQNVRTCMSTLVGLLDFAILNPKWPKHKPWVDGYVRISYYLDWIEEVVWGAAKQARPDGPSIVNSLTEKTDEPTVSPTTNEPINYDFVFPDQFAWLMANRFT
ncbi:polyserase-2 isoform X2 [Aedes aegypti]|uniref:Peptidase S1 domain-containing protein n=1 Tax=Aedes aegypti TaxID=7159 RepID=A0A6I8TMK6_AEDAE|nr:polyserase-2 isoform X2 [Aedes aegypti]